MITQDHRARIVKSYLPGGPIMYPIYYMVPWTYGSPHQKLAQGTVVGLSPKQRDIQTDRQKTDICSNSLPLPVLAMLAC